MGPEGLLSNESTKQFLHLQVHVGDRLGCDGRAGVKGETDLVAIFEEVAKHEKDIVFQVFLELCGSDQSSMRLF